MPDELEERLRSHAKSFDSLLSLIPAKLYYGEDVSDQWKRKKQTPEQKRAAKMAKLDPDNWKSAKDVMDERSAAAKRKRGEEEASDSEELVEPEQPKTIQDEELHKLKKRKTDQTEDEKQDTQQAVSISDKRREKQERQAEKKAAKKEKKKKQKDEQTIKQDKLVEDVTEHDKSWVDVEEGDGQPAEAIGADQIPLNVLDDVEMADDASTAPSSNPTSPIMSPAAESGSSSISSIPASISDQPTTLPETKPSKKTKTKSEPTVPATTTAVQQPVLDASAKAAARARLAEAITSMRTQRKADTNPRSRQELLDQRRRKEDVRRLAKKDQRRKEKDEETRKADEEIERRFSPGGSGSLLGSPRSPPTSTTPGAAGGGNTFSFGRISFPDGTEADTTHLSGLLPQHHKKGPQDINTALLASQNKHNRLSGLDENKRKQIEEQDTWLTAKRRAHGERVKDDSSLLKKALKRQEGQKRKSEKEWTDRKEGVQKSQEMKQKKREGNLNKRKEEKKGAGGGGKKAAKKVKRPGFEGSFRGRSGGGKKK